LNERHWLISISDKFTGHNLEISKLYSPVREARGEKVNIVNEQMSKYVCVYLDDLAPQVKIATRKDHLVLNEEQWSKLVTLKKYKCIVHELVDPSHNLFKYCGRCVRIK
jgi:uncharacterized protein YbcC (UPF0753/DUF2309 family)